MRSEPSRINSTTRIRLVSCFRDSCTARLVKYLFRVSDAPVLLIAFNRPDRLERLIDTIRAHRPSCVRIAIDGPRPSVPEDVDAVEATARAAARVDWTSDVVVHQHETNRGITVAIPWAVSWVLREFTQAVIIEDDVTVGPQFLEFADRALARWSDDTSTFAVSGYNVVPESHLSQAESAARYSRMVHSYAWATWRRAWEHYDPDMNWFGQRSLSELEQLLGSRWAALRWRQYAAHVRSGRVTTWDYQWAMSVWSQGGRTVMPNRNLIEYHGMTGGTHTTRRRSWGELPVARVDLSSVGQLAADEPIDLNADSFVQLFGHRSTPVGVGLGYLEAPAMRALKTLQGLRSA